MLKRQKMYNLLGIHRKMREKQYVNHWNIGEHMKNYDALDDAYSQLHFDNPLIKKHFRKFEKAVKKEVKTSDLLRMTFLLDKKYRRPSIMGKNMSQNEISIKSTKQIKLMANKPSSLQKLEKIGKNESEVQFQHNLQEQNQKGSTVKLQSSKANFPQKANKLQKIYRSHNEESDNLRVLNRKQFSRFLSKKKEEISHDL